MPVKSMAVPEVEATAVPRVRMLPTLAKVAVASGSVIVRFEFVLGLSRMIVPVPDAFPLTVRLDML
jgi:hypothetical protein